MAGRRRRVLLDAASSPGAEPPFRQLRLRIEHGALLLNGAREGRYSGIRERYS
jgi:hypothetical protein